MAKRRGQQSIYAIRLMLIYASTWDSIESIVKMLHKCSTKWIFASGQESQRTIFYTKYGKTFFTMDSSRFDGVSWVVSACSILFNLYISTCFHPAKVLVRPKKFFDFDIWRKKIAYASAPSMLSFQFFVLSERKIWIWYYVNSNFNFYSTLTQCVPWLQLFQMGFWLESFHT